VLVYGVISTVTEKAVALLPTRGEADAFIGEVEADEPELAALLRVEEVDLGRRVNSDTNGGRPAESLRQSLRRAAEWF
jgi:hypothetical protein